MNNALPSKFVGGYKHAATLDCINCDGTGQIRYTKCMACGGRGNYVVSCGGSVEVDENYGSAYCRNCGHFVPYSEVI